MYSIKAVTNITGIAGDTLRAWERRYSAVSPRRDPNGRRVYSQNDVNRLRLLKNASAIGYPIGKISKLDDDELMGLVDAATETSSMSATKSVTERLIKAAREYRQDLCDEILGVSVIGLKPLELATELFAPTLTEIGLLWERGEISIAQEHLLTSSIKRILSSITDHYRKQADGDALIFSTLSQERHEFGILLCNLVASSLGFRTFYFGADLPPEELVAAAKAVRPKAIVVSVVFLGNDKNYAPQLSALCQYVKGLCGVIVGGRMSRDALSIVGEDQALYLPDLKAFHDYLISFKSISL